MGVLKVSASILHFFNFHKIEVETDFLLFILFIDILENKNNKYIHLKNYF